VEALGTLAGGIAHDFNNILLAISGNAKLAMEDTDLIHPAQRSLREIARASARATSLVQRILAFSRQTEPRRELIQLRPAVQEALKLLRSTLPAMIEIRTDMSASVPWVKADSTQIHQVMMNLMTNSAHAIGAGGGVVTVRLDAVEQRADEPALADGLATGPYVRLSIQDTGCGMDRATLERIFDPFFTTKPAGQGTGLGLSVVHGIVRNHHGAITVESSPGLGTTFSLYFPAAGNGEHLTVPATPEPATGHGQRILYIDDEDAVVYLATRQLQRLGYAVIGFTDPGKALLAFRANPGSFDVVVTDVSMPGMSGFHLAQAILKLRADVPVLMTSGYVRPEDRDAAAKLGVHELISKPHTIDALGHALERLFHPKP
jgi:CheY-like chemotaxis protein